MASTPRLDIKPMQDGAGYFYGTLDVGADHVYRVDILPPLSEPRPFFVMTSDGMHPTDWIVYLDGEEIARVTKRDDIEAAVLKALPATA